MIPAVDLSGFELNSIENSRFLAAKGIPGAVRFAIWHAPKLYLDFGMTSSVSGIARLHRWIFWSQVEFPASPRRRNKPGHLIGSMKRAEPGVMDSVRTLRSISWYCLLRSEEERRLSERCRRGDTDARCNSGPTKLCSSVHGEFLALCRRSLTSRSGARL
jgi:hypothetical protein